MDMYLMIGVTLAVLGLGYATGLLQAALRFVYGDFEPAERNKFLLYGSLFFFIIGVYWLLRCVKDSVFNAFVGSEYTMIAKMVSLVVVFPLVMGYSYLVDKFPRQRLFYAMSTIYAGLFFVLAMLLGNESFGMYADETGRWSLLGWTTYIAIESFGSLMVVLFYSFMADTTTPQQGKKGYFITATFAQIGAIFGSGLVQMGSCALGVHRIVGIGGIATLLIIPIVRFIMWAIPASEFEGYKTKTKEKKTKPGFTEGLKLMLTQPYLLGIFVVVAAFEIVATIFDLQFKILIAEFAAGDASVFASYSGGFGVYVSTLALLSLLLGIGKIGRKIGITMSLALMPLLMITNIVVLKVSPVLSVVFWIMVASKGINYALGQPSKEQLFIPTTKDSKYKAKTWVDMFGSRFSKATGSGIKLVQTMLGLGSFFLLGTSAMICVVWFIFAMYLGKTNTHAVDNNEVVC